MADDYARNTTQNEENNSSVALIEEEGQNAGTVFTLLYKLHIHGRAPAITVMRSVLQRLLLRPLCPTLYPVVLQK